MSLSSDQQIQSGASLTCYRATFAGVDSAEGNINYDYSIWCPKFLDFFFWFFFSLILQGKGYRHFILNQPSSRKCDLQLQTITGHFIFQGTMGHQCLRQMKQCLSTVKRVICTHGSLCSRKGQPRPDASMSPGESCSDLFLWLIKSLAMAQRSLNTHKIRKTLPYN